MTPRSYAIPAVLPLLLFVASVLASRGLSDWAAQLPGGYQLVRTSAASVMIFRPSGAMVPPKVVRLDVRQSLVYGEAEAPPDAEVGAVSGYFVLDTATGEVGVGLDEAQWLGRLRQRGITDRPPLKPAWHFSPWSSWVPGLLSIAAVASLGIVVTHATTRRSSRRSMGVTTEDQR